MRDLAGLDFGLCSGLVPGAAEAEDESVRGWEEQVDGIWVQAADAKISNVAVQEGVLDSLRRPRSGNTSQACWC